MLSREGNYTDEFSQRVEEDEENEEEWKLL